MLNQLVIVHADTNARHTVEVYPELLRGRISGKQVARGDLERERDLVDDGDGRVAGTAFDVADVSAVDVRLMGESLLAQPFGIPQAAQVSAEALAYIHACLQARLSPINLQTIRDNLVDCLGVSSMVLSPIVDRNASMAQHFTGLRNSMIAGANELHPNRMARSSAAPTRTDETQA